VAFRSSGGTVSVYLVGRNGNVNTKKTYEASWFGDDPENIIFIHFDGIDWVKEGHHDEWTVPHKP